MTLNPNRRFGLLGRNIQHSKSPLLWEAAYGTTHGTYELIEAENFIGSFEKTRDLDGFNITQPYKKDYYEMCHMMTDHVAYIKAVNCIRRDKTNEGQFIFNQENQQEGSILVGANSDVFAVICMQHIIHFGYYSLFDALSNLDPSKMVYRGSEERNLLDSKKATVTIIGAGGAGCAAADAFAMGEYDVYVWNRTQHKATELCNSYPWLNMYPLDDHHHTLVEYLPQSSIVVYALPVKDQSIISMIPDSAVVIEPNYANPCLNDRELYLGGDVWLLMQAIAGFEFLTGIRPNVNRMLEAFPINIPDRFVKLTKY